MESEGTANGRVRLMVKREFIKSVMYVRRISPRILSINVVLCGKVVDVVSVYGPHSCRCEDDKDSFYDDLSAKMQSKGGNCILMGDFNGHVESSIDGYEGVHGG